MSFSKRKVEFERRVKGHARVVNPVGFEPGVQQLLLSLGLTREKEGPLSSRMGWLESGGFMPGYA
jgi:hypothetical protein